LRSQQEQNPQTRDTLLVEAQQYAERALVTSTAIHIIAIDFFAGASVFLARDHANRERRSQ
jgi:hypothetical protein